METEDKPSTDPTEDDSVEAVDESRGIEERSDSHDGYLSNSEDRLSEKDSINEVPLEDVGDISVSEADKENVQPKHRERSEDTKILSSEEKNNKKNESEKNKSEHGEKKKKVREDKPPSKVVVRRLPPTMTESVFLEQVSPLPQVDYMYFVPGDLSQGPHAFSRAYLNFVNQDDLFAFTRTFDNYVFVDSKGHEYPAVVEFAPYQRVPKQRSKKKDVLIGTIESDPAYITFKENYLAEALESSKSTSTIAKQHYFETTENTESQEVTTTPLLEYLKAKKAEKARIKEEKREDKKRKEAERKLKQQLKLKEKKQEAEEESKSQKAVSQLPVPTPSIKIQKDDKDPDKPLVVPSFQSSGITSTPPPIKAPEPFKEIPKNQPKELPKEPAVESDKAAKQTLFLKKLFGLIPSSENIARVDTSIVEARVKKDEPRSWSEPVKIPQTPLVVIDKALNTNNLLPSAFPRLAPRGSEVDHHDQSYPNPWTLGVPSGAKEKKEFKEKEPKVAKNRDKDKDKEKEKDKESKEDKPPKDGTDKPVALKSREFRSKGGKSYRGERVKLAEKREEKKKLLSSGSKVESEPVKEETEEGKSTPKTSSEVEVKSTRSRSDRASRREEKRKQHEYEKKSRSAKAEKKSDEPTKVKMDPQPSQEVQEEVPKRRNSVGSKNEDKTDNGPRRRNSVGSSPNKGSEFSGPTPKRGEGDHKDRKSVDGKDPRVERRIRNKDRPSLEIYRPGMGKFSRQRLVKEKQALGSSTEVESPSHSPSPTPVVSNNPPT